MKRIVFALFAVGFVVFLNIPDAGAQACGNFTPRLEIGMWARVTPGEPNNVRILPLHQSERVGQIPGGGEFLVLDGPECDNNYTWWKVDHNGLIGWTAEWGHIYGEYWLEPYESARPASTIPPTSRPTNAPPPTNPPANTPVPTVTPIVEDQRIGMIAAPSGARPKDSNVPANIWQVTGYTAASLTGQVRLTVELDKDFLEIDIDCPYDPERSRPTVRSKKWANYDDETHIATLNLSYQWFEVLQGPSLCFHNDVQLDSVEAVELSTGTSYPAESYYTNFNSGGTTRSVFLPIVAYARGGNWQLSANGYWFTIEINKQHSNIMIVGKTEFTEDDETVITGLNPYETVAITEVRHPTSGGIAEQVPPSQVRVVQYFQANSDGNAYLGDIDLYWFMHRYRQGSDYASYLAVFGEDGTNYTRFIMSDIIIENIRRNIWGQ